MVVPASAVDGSTFWDYFSLNFAKENISNWWKTLFGSDDPDTAYTDYVTTVKDVLGTSTVGDNCVYLGNWSDHASYNSTAGENVSYTFASGSTFTYSGTVSRLNDEAAIMCSSSFVAPVSGTYKFTGFWSTSNKSVFLLSGFRLQLNGSNITFSNVAVADSGESFLSYDLTAGTTYGFAFLWVAPSSTSGPFTVSGACRMEYPTGGFEAAAGSTDVSPETRTGSLCGDYFYSGDNGSMTQAENIYLFDETNNIINNPATGTTATASSWKYDYETRTYTITATDGSTYTIVHGDESAEVTYTDSSNTTNIYNYYYGTNGGGGENPGEQPDKESIWDKLGKLLGSITDGFLEVVKAFLGKLLDSLTSLVDMINSKIGNIVESILALFDYFPSLFSGFTGFLAAVFPFLPQEFFDILILGAALAAVLLILKVLRK